MYSATSFIISSKTPTMTATATKDWTLQERTQRLSGPQRHVKGINHRQNNAGVSGHATSEAGDTRRADGTRTLWWGWHTSSQNELNTHVHILCGNCVGSTGNPCRNQGRANTLKRTQKACFLIFVGTRLGQTWQEARAAAVCTSQ